MNPSTFIQYINKFWASTVLRLTQRYNGEANPRPYLFKTMLKKVFSTDLKWSSLSQDNIYVAADVVSMDSSLPLKKRGAVAKTTGEIPKIGMKLYLSESQMSRLNILRNTPGMESQFIADIFADTDRCLMGVNEQLEKMFIEGLSTGVTVIDDTENVGLGIRIDYGYPSANQYGVAHLWSDPSTSTPIDDIENVISNALGNIPTVIWMNRSTYNQFISSAQVKSNYYPLVGAINASSMPNLTRKNVDELLADKFGMTIQIVDRTVTLERDGVRTPYRPWAADRVVFTSGTDVGSLTYGILAEAQNPNKAVSYAKADDYVLLSKWHSVDPYSEFTSSQALVVPVIDNVDSIYVIDTTDAENDAQTEGDSTITVFGDSTVTVDNLITALDLVGVNADASMTDVQLINLVNKLSKKNENKVRASLELPTVNAGTDITGASGTEALLGVVTPATGKTILSTLWTQESGATASISTPNALGTNVTGLVTGAYEFKLTATDSDGMVASDTITVTV